MSDVDLARRGISRETDIRLDRDGLFFSAGQPVEHPRVAGAFARWIERTDTGRYALRNDLHYVYVQVEDAPLHARGAEVEGEGDEAQVVLILNGDVRQPLDPRTLRQGPGGDLYADGRDGTWPIRLLPGAVLALEPLLGEEDGEVMLQVGGYRGAVPRVEDPLSSRGAGPSS